MAASSFGSEAAAPKILALQAPRVNAEEMPHGTHVAFPCRLMDVCASGMALSNLLGADGMHAAR